MRVIANTTTDYITSGKDYFVVNTTFDKYEIIDNLYLNGFYNKTLFNSINMTYCSSVQKKLNEAKLKGNLSITLQLSTQQLEDLKECGYVTKRVRGNKYRISE